MRGASVGWVLGVVLAGCGHKASVPHEDAGPAPAASVVYVDKECPKVEVAAPASLEPAKPQAPEVLVTRAVKTVRVNDVDETWVLRWRGTPKKSCVDEDWFTCPCWGFAFGESGHLELARLRPNLPEEILDFTKHDADLVLQRWIPKEKDDTKANPTDKYLQTLEVFDPMQIRDYDHDGEATEFVFRSGVGGACGHTSLFDVVGISKKNPKLHFFGVTLPHLDDWESVRTMPMPGELKLLTWRCGDHGSESEESLLVTLDAKGTLKTKELKRTCKANE